MTSLEVKRNFGAPSTSPVVKSDDFAIDDRVLWQIAQGVDDVRILSAERFPVSGNEAQLALRFQAWHVRKRHATVAD
jgi:hypothetical protein